MPFIVEPHPGEEVYLQKEFRGLHSHVFAMAVSNQAVYVSAQKFVVKGDRWYFKRVPLSDLREVRLVKQRPSYLIMLSAIMIAFGGFVSFQMMWLAFHPEPGMSTRGSGWPFAILVGGIIMPFIARGRKTLIVRMRKGKFKWQSQLAVDRKTRELYSSLHDEIVQACKRAGVHVVASQ